MVLRFQLLIKNLKLKAKRKKQKMKIHLNVNGQLLVIQPFLKVKEEVFFPL